MKNIYTLTVLDSLNNNFTFTQNYSNKKAALNSFENIQNHTIEKYNLKDKEIVTYSFNTGGLNKTNIIDNRFNITLNVWSLETKESTFINTL